MGMTTWKRATANKTYLDGPGPKDLLGVGDVFPGSSFAWVRNVWPSTRRRSALCRCRSQKKDVGRSERRCLPKTDSLALHRPMG